MELPSQVPQELIPPPFPKFGRWMTELRRPNGDISADEAQSHLDLLKGMADILPAAVDDVTTVIGTPGQPNAYKRSATYFPVRSALEGRFLQSYSVWMHLPHEGPQGDISFSSRHRIPVLDRLPIIDKPEPTYLQAYSTRTDAEGLIKAIFTSPRRRLNIRGATAGEAPEQEPVPYIARLTPASFGQLANAIHDEAARSIDTAREQNEIKRRYDTSRGRQVWPSPMGRRIKLGKANLMSGPSGLNLQDIRPLTVKDLQGENRLDGFVFDSLWLSMAATAGAETVGRMVDFLADQRRSAAAAQPAARAALSR
jgi:hypothetical protein